MEKIGTPWWKLDDWEIPRWAEEPYLCDAMLAWLRRKRVDAAAVMGYAERSYNIGYCDTCSEIVTELVVYYNERSGRPRRYDYEAELGVLIRELTPTRP